MNVRKFKLINASGNEWNLMQRSAYFSDPEGLGIGIDAEYIRIGQTYEQIQSVSAQKAVSGNMLFRTYTDYRAFADFIIDSPLKLAYMPEEEWYFLDCSVTGMDKTEKGTNHWLTCPITFTAESMWYRPTIAKGTSPTVDNAKKYTYKYKSATTPTTPTISGNPLTTQYAESGTPSALSADIEPIQDLHGYSKPWAGGAGKNKFPMTVNAIKAWNGGASSWNGNSKVINGITWTIQTDSDDNVTGIKANGTATAISMLQITDTMSFTANDIINGSIGGSNTTYGIGGSSIGLQQFDNDYVITAGFAASDRYIYCRVQSGVTVSDIIFYPMLRSATETDATFEPYTNICPISGSTDVTITREGTDPSDTEEVTIQLGQTVYGGTLDVLTGVLTVNKAILNPSEYTYNLYTSGGRRRFETALPNFNLNATSVLSDSICTHLVNVSATSGVSYPFGNFSFTRTSSTGTAYLTFYDSESRFSTANDFQTWLADMVTAGTPVQICYPLRTPITVQLTAEQIELLEGYNILTTDADSLTMTYTANIPTGDAYYTYADELNGYIRINNQSSSDSPCIISIMGAIENPTYTLTANDEQIASGSILTTIPAGNKVVIDSRDGKLEVAEYVANTDEFVRNLYQYIDFDRETFIHVPQGNSMLYISGEASDSIAAWVEVEEIHETI